MPGHVGADVDCREEEVDESFAAYGVIVISGRGEEVVREGRPEILVAFERRNGNRGVGEGGRGDGRVRITGDVAGGRRASGVVAESGVRCIR